jgi:hypothetical protein
VPSLNLVVRRHCVTLAEKFREEATGVARELAARLRETLTFAEAILLPESNSQDIVVAGKEAQLTIYRQVGVSSQDGQVLVTVQVARHALGGVVSFHIEKGIVFSPTVPARDATEKELLASGA